MAAMSRPAVAAIVLSVLCTSASAQTVIGQSKQVGGTAQAAAFNDSNASASLSSFQLADGTNALYVTWGGLSPEGYFVGVAGIAPLSAAGVKGGQISISFELESLLQVYYQFGSPGPCVGTFSPAPDDRSQYRYSVDTSGNQKRTIFQPFGWTPGGTLYETTVSGRTTESSARFSGTCAGAVISADSPTQTGYMQAHTGNMTQTITLVP